MTALKELGRPPTHREILVARYRDMAHKPHDHIANDLIRLPRNADTKALYALADLMLTAGVFDAAISDRSENGAPADDADAIPVSDIIDEFAARLLVAEGKASGVDSLGREVNSLNGRVDQMEREGVKADAVAVQVKEMNERYATLLQRVTDLESRAPAKK